MRVSNFILTIFVAASASLSTFAVAGDKAVEPPPGVPQAKPVKAVIELFTSQGCSSCPPADALLKTMAADPAIIALSLPVDYWNYLGWKDTFASARNTERQRNYARTRGDGAIYTPQVIVNGSTHLNGAAKIEIDHAIDAATEQTGPSQIPVRFWQERNTLNFAIGSDRADHAPRQGTVWLAVVQSTGTIDVAKGENEGKALTYTNIVRELTPIGLWKGQPMLIQLPRAALMQPDAQKIVVLVQEERSGPIIGATMVGLW